jgi:hypothetical protein
MARAIRRHRSASALSSADVIIFVTSPLSRAPHQRRNPTEGKSELSAQNSTPARIARAVLFADGRAVEIPVF